MRAAWRSPRWGRALLLALLCVGWTIPAAAQSGSGDSGRAPGPTDGGGWVFVPENEPGSPSAASPASGVASRILVYIPPRTSDGVGGSSAPGGDADPGLVQRAMTIGTPVEAMATINGRAVLVIAPEPRVGTAGTDGAMMRRVLGKQAYRSPAAAVWSFLPRARMETFPPLPGTGDLVGLVGSASGPSTHRTPIDTRPADQQAMYAHIRGLSDAEYQELGGQGVVPRDVLLGVSFSTGQRAWSIVPPPEQMLESSWSLVRVLDGPAWLVSDGLAWRMYLASGDRINLAPLPTDKGRDDGIDPRLALQTGRIWAGRNGLLMLREQPDGALALSAWDRTGWYELGTPVAAKDDWDATLLDHGSRLAIITTEWVTSEPGDQRASRTRKGTGENAATDAPAGPRRTAAYTITELSTLTGDVLYAGDTKGPRVVSALAMQVLLVSVLLLTGAALFVALRADPLDGAVPLPDGVALASHSQRAFAMAVDVLFALAAAGLVTGTPLPELFIWDSWLHTRDGWVVLVLAYVLLWAHAVTMDMALGGTLGRMLTGTRVVRLQGAAPMPAGSAEAAGIDEQAGAAPGQFSASRLRAPSLGQSLLRNTLKLALPPLGLLMLLDPSGRHRAEQLSRTAVIAVPRRSSGDAGTGSGDA